MLLTIARDALLRAGLVRVGVPAGGGPGLFGPDGTRKVAALVAAGQVWDPVRDSADGGVRQSGVHVFRPDHDSGARGGGPDLGGAEHRAPSRAFAGSRVLAMLPLAIILLALNTVEKRFWCRYLCPLGAIVGLGSKVAWIRRYVNEDSCVKCGDCVKTCPMGAINPETIRHDPAECVMCLDCAPVCPKTAITFEQRPLPRWHHEFDPGRRELIGATAASAAGLVLFNTSVAKAAAPDLLRPPGVAPKEAAVPAPSASGAGSACRRARARRCTRRCWA